jgi:hypothetical protein
MRCTNRHSAMTRAVQTDLQAVQTEIAHLRLDTTTLADTTTEIKDNTIALQDDAAEQRKRSLMEWLCTEDHHKRYRDYIGRYQAGKLPVNGFSKTQSSRVGSHRRDQPSSVPAIQVLEKRSWRLS